MVRLCNYSGRAPYSDILDLELNWSFVWQDSHCHLLILWKEVKKSWHTTEMAMNTKWQLSWSTSLFTCMFSDSKKQLSLFRTSLCERSQFFRPVPKSKTTSGFVDFSFRHGSDISNSNPWQASKTSCALTFYFFCQHPQFSSGGTTGITQWFRFHWLVPLQQNRAKAYQPSSGACLLLMNSTVSRVNIVSRSWKAILAGTEARCRVVKGFAALWDSCSPAASIVLCNMQHNICKTSSPVSLPSHWILYDLVWLSRRKLHCLDVS